MSYLVASRWIRPDIGAQHVEAAGWYFDFGYPIHPKSDLDVRYDTLSRVTETPSKWRKLDACPQIDLQETLPSVFAQGRRRELAPATAGALFRRALDI